MLEYLLGILMFAYLFSNLLHVVVCTEGVLPSATQLQRAGTSPLQVECAEK
jgi:hypothetical protein